MRKDIHFARLDHEYHWERKEPAELERNNKALEEYAFINANKLRSPVASILGLIPIFRSISLNDEAKDVVDHLEKSTKRLDAIVGPITMAIEKGETVALQT